MPRSFTGPELLAALSKGSTLDPMYRKGIVKRDKDQADSILFSEGISGEQWTRIPIDIIDKVDHITNVSSNGQDFPFVRLYLKEPSDDNREAKVLLSLLRAVPRSSNSPSTVVEDQASLGLVGG